MMRTTDAIVLGGGVIGLAIARSLCQAGLSVTVFERNPHPGSEASWAAGGMLSPQAEAEAPGPLLDLCVFSRSLYPDLADALREETGMDIELRREGTLLPALTEVAASELTIKANWQAQKGLRATILSAAEARTLEPSLLDGLHSALWLPDDWQVDNRRLTHALIGATYQAGADIHCQVSPIRLLVREQRVEGVAVGWDVWHSPIVINAAGSWATQFFFDIPKPFGPKVRPIRGQMLALEMQPPTLLRHVVRSRDLYLIPRLSGRLIIGATVEDVGFSKQVTPRGISTLLQRAMEVVPALADLSLIDTWAGLRPLAEDQLPILGKTEIDGMFCATGHYRNGILLTPVTALVMRALVLNEASPVPIEPFSPLRFQSSSSR